MPLRRVPLFYPAEPQSVGRRGANRPTHAAAIHSVLLSHRPDLERAGGHGADELPPSRAGEGEELGFPGLLSRSGRGPRADHGGAARRYIEAALPAVGPTGTSCLSPSCA